MAYHPAGPQAALVEKLRTASILWFILGGITALFSLIPLFHVGLGVIMLTGSFPDDPTPPPDFFAYAFILVGAVAIAVGMALSFCMILTGLRLRQLRSRTCCIVVSALACTAFPFGTALGVWTLIVLCRPETPELFAT